MDSWNPATFDAELEQMLERNSELIATYYREDKRLMDEHLNSHPYESLKPNEYFAEFQPLKEHVVTPMMEARRIRVWHYTRITDYEVTSMQNNLVSGSLVGLQERLRNLNQQGLLTEREIDIIYRDSPYHVQENIRCGRLCAVDCPLTADDSGVEPLLANWGGESAYFWLSDKDISAKLKTIGTPRIIEIETPLKEGLNAYKAAETVIESWARKLGVGVKPTCHDLFIMNCVKEAQVLHINTKGDRVFEKVGRSYPVYCADLLHNKNQQISQ